MADATIRVQDTKFSDAGDVTDRPRLGCPLPVKFDYRVVPPAVASGTRIPTYSTIDGKVTWTSATGRAPMVTYFEDVPVWNYTASSAATDSRMTGTNFPSPVRTLSFVLRTTDTTQGLITAAWSGTGTPYPFDLIRLAGPTSPRWGANTSGQGLRAPVQAEFFSWHSVTVVLAGASSRLYFDGISSPPAISSSAASIPFVNFGGRGTAPLPFQMVEKNFRVATITDAEALAVHRGYKAGYPQLALV